MTKGRSLELFFIDGKPDGMLTAEVFNWTGHVLKAPRTKIKEVLARTEAEYTGVYLLLGETETGPLAYIGEAEDLGARIRGHVSKKGWWETVVMITSTANNLHKAHVKYLESRLVEMAQSSKHIPLENLTTPTRSSLSEAATANMEEFLETLQMVLPAIQVDLLVNKAQPRGKKEAPISEGTFPEFEITSERIGVQAFAILKDGEFIILKDSMVKNEWRNTNNNKGNRERYLRVRENLEATGVISMIDGTTQFVRDYQFSSPSNAATFVFGRGANGRTSWLLRGTMKTYAEWEAEQIENDEADI